MRSALFKLLGHHSCAMFDEESQHIETDSAPRVRQCMQQCLDMVREICERVVSFCQNLEQQLLHDAMESASPLIIHCIYSCAVNLSWLYLETNNAQYIRGKRVCENTLEAISLRWRVAGTYNLECL